MSLEGDPRAARLVLVADPRSVPDLVVAPGARVLAVTARAARALAAAGREAPLLDEQAEPDDAARADRFALDVSGGFTRDPASGVDLSTWRGFPLAELLEHALLSHEVSPVARLAIHLRAAWARADRGEVAHDLAPGSLEREVLRCVLGRPGGDPPPPAPPPAPERWKGLARAAWNGLVALRRATGAPGGGRVLLMLYPSLMPLVEAIARGGAPDLDLLVGGGRPRRDLLPALARRGVRLFSPERGARGAAEAEARPIARALHDALDGALAPNLRLLDVDLRPALAPRLRAALARLPGLAGELAGTEVALRRRRVDLVVVPFDVGEQTRLTVRAAERVGVPSLVLLHGLPGYFHTSENRIATHLGVFSEPVRELFLGAGFAPGRVHLVPSPALGRLMPAPPAPDDGPVLVLGSPRAWIGSRAVEGTSDRYARDVLAALRDVAPERPITFKLHPAEDPDEQAGMLASLGRPVDGVRTRLVHRGDLHALIRAARVVIGPFSTASLETALLGRPYLAYLPPPIELPAPFDRGGDAEACRTQDELAAALREALAPGARQRAAGLVRWAGPGDPDAARVLAFLRSLARR